MNIIHSIKEKIGEMIEKNRERAEERANLPDDVTTDQHLRYLRRERRVQMEELEKKRLKKAIHDFKAQKEKREVWGITDDKVKNKKKYVGLFQKAKL